MRRSRDSPFKYKSQIPSYSVKLLATLSENLHFFLVHSGEEAGPVPELPARSRTQGKKKAIMEDRVFQELPDDFWDTPPARASYKVKLDDSDSDFESALLKEVRIITFISFCSCMQTHDHDVVLSNTMCNSSCFLYLHSTALMLCLAYV